MDLTWYGLSCFRIRGRQATVVTDPYPSAAGLRAPRWEGDLVTVSHHHPNHDQAALVRGATLIDGPGEYEVKGVGVLGVHSYHDGQAGQAHGPNTIYVIELDEVRVCHLGDLGHRLDDQTLEALDEVDVLLVPTGGGSALDGTQAAEVVRQIEPRFVVPMHFFTPGLKVPLEPLDRFLKEMGVAAPEPAPRLSVQASAGEYETRIVVLEPRTQG